MIDTPIRDRTTRTERRIYRGSGGTGAPSIVGLPGVHRDGAAAAQVLEVERHDTDDRRLAAAGIALGLHRAGVDHEHRRWLR